MDHMDVITAKLLKKAKLQYGDVTFCGSKKNWRDCVTQDPNTKNWLLWFNTSDDSTRVVSLDKNS